MSKPASAAIMARLHAKLAEYLTDILSEAIDDEDGLPLDAASMGVIRGFLKDNDITSDPAERDDLDDLRRRLSKSSQSGAVNTSVLNALKAAQDDMDKVH